MALQLGLALLALQATCQAVPLWYSAQREAFLKDELDARTGAKLVLNAKEGKVNVLLMTHKLAAVEASRTTTTPFPPAVHFFRSKATIDNSTVFDIIKRMPKGGILHIHRSAMTSLDWVIQNLTYLPDLYTHVDETIPLRTYKFSKQDPGSGWESVSSLRAASGDPAAFDLMLKTNLSIWTPEPEKAYPTINDVWHKFINYFRSIYGLLTYDNRRMYYRRFLEEFYEDGVQYVEIRGSPSEYMIHLLEELVKEFQVDHPDFIGWKQIVSVSRSNSRSEVAEAINETIQLMHKYPDVVKGFDLVGQEDVLHTQEYFLDQLLDPARGNNSVVPYFFHAGETDWTQGVDVNLVDAVLLNSSRIGHGFAALRHPGVMERVSAGVMAIELNPISNQVLGLLADLRNHPGAVFMAKDMPVVVSSDDPPVWDATPLSHDFYMAFMGLGAVHDDLRLLKQLAINSFRFSAMTDSEKSAALVKWQKRWDAFIDQVILDYKL